MILLKGFILCSMEQWDFQRMLLLKKLISALMMRMMKVIFRVNYFWLEKKEDELEEDEEK